MVRFPLLRESFFISILSMRITKKRMLKTLLIISGIYVAGGVALYFLQDLLLFHPKPLPKDHKFSFTYPYQEMNLLINDRNLNIVQFKTDAAAKGVVLYFHGNMQNIERYQNIVPLFTHEGYELWMMDYPGFGKSTGKRTEARIYEDAQRFYQLASERFEPSQIIIYGRSVGTGPAAQLASVKAAKMLILETPYYSIDALAKSYFPIYPVKMLTTYTFPVNDYLKHVNAPAYIIHGTSDEVIPYEQAKILRKENPATHLITIEKGEHNNLAEFPLFRATLKRLLYNK
jgi:pimeloyl-ACP methyl ester carboxylesterase